MTKYKKYIRDIGIMLECDYPYMPYDFPHAEYMPVLDGILTWIDLEVRKIVIKKIYVVGDEYTYIDIYGKREFDFK